MSEFDALKAGLDETRERFLALVGDLRPQLHRYCSRMTGSAMDGEDLVQETLAQAYFKLSTLNHSGSLRTWIFAIAHRKCLDFLRSRRTQPEWREEAEAAVVPEAENQVLVDEALARLVHALPPKERGCIVLKDVLGYSLQEAAEILDSSVGAVKAALHRGRAKLKQEAAGPPARTGAGPPDAEAARLLARYAALFTAKDWRGLEALLHAGVRCEVVGVYAGVGVAALAAGYIENFSKLEDPQMLVAALDGERVAISREWDGDRRVTRSVVRVEWRDGKVKSIRDYRYVPYLLDGARLTLCEGA